MEADEGKLLKEEMDFCADTTVQDFIDHITGIELQIERVRVGPQSDGFGPGGEFAWAELTYRFILAAPDGSRIASWTEMGRGETIFPDFDYLEAYSLATGRAMTGAAGKFVASFRNVPEVRDWLHEIGIVR
jgi:hypothetical protein